LDLLSLSANETGKEAETEQQDERGEVDGGHPEAKRRDHPSHREDDRIDDPVQEDLYAAQRVN
jgi:hypothetical protein